MPSANPKLEKQASTEATDPIRQAITVIEHKIRNLEKRKGKLESYKDLQKNGKELNHDQKTAVAKYDEVLQTLEITRELYKQIVGISNDFAKQQKKQARKEALERMQQDTAKVREVLLIQDVLINIGGEVVREDFLAGANGAAKLTQDDLKYLDDFYNEVTMKRQPESGEPAFAQQLQKAAEHYMGILEGKQREVVGTTYSRLKEIITSVNSCGYFDQVQIQETEVITTEVALDAPVEVTTGDGKGVVEQPSEEYNNSGEVTIIPPPESMIPMPNFPVRVAPVAVVTGAAPVAGPITVVAAPQAVPAPHPTAPVETAYYANAAGYVPQPQPAQQPQPQQQTPPRINDVIGTPNFFFLQESELDQPDVAAGQAPPPTIVQHIPPPAVNAPIPTQTFTNQNFTGTPVQVPQQVIYQHPPQEMSHIPGFANPNPPPPIPMPPSHQQQNIQYSPQHPAGQFQPPAGQQAVQPTQNFDQQETQQQPEEKNEQHVEEPEVAPAEADSSNEPVNWCQMADAPMDEWSSNENAQQSEHSDHQQSQQAWGEQRSSGYRGRGGRRGNSNGYNGRGRGGGNYQQNGRGGGQGSYYRNDNSNYQNGYQPRNYNNDGGNSNYNGNFKRGGGGGSGGGGPRTNSRGGDRPGIDRGGRGGQFRGGQRGGNRGGGYVPRGKPQTQQ
ncbi:caprin homolog isoform X2 [Microplitis mediator]|uniref:caprin homolog isoform X2 n=1 Tax=Microplitis mediator TaxID=375433 RepID=UPI00255534E0|nr:caprin homolog isoform X2 [Microplitis mediator]